MVPIYWLWFAAVGGAVLGIFVFALCNASGRADDEMEAFWARHDQHDEDDQDVEDFVKRIGGHH